MTDDPLEDLRALRDDLARTAVPFAQAQAAMTSTSGSDSTGSVLVSLSASGELEQVRVDGDWRERLSADALGPAVLEALAAAATERLGAFTRTVAESAEEAGSPPGTAVPPPAVEEGVTAALAAALRGRPDRLPDAALEGLLRTLREVNEDVSGLRAKVQEGLAATHTARSTSGHVRAVASGAGDVVELHLDPAWVARAHATNLGREVKEAVQAARTAAARGGPQALVAGSSIGRLAALAQDPQALLDHLGHRA